MGFPLRQPKFVDHWRLLVVSWLDSHYPRHPHFFEQVLVELIWPIFRDYTKHPWTSGEDVGRSDDPHSRSLTLRILGLYSLTSSNILMQGTPNYFSYGGSEVSSASRDDQRQVNSDANRCNFLSCISINHSLVQCCWWWPISAVDRDSSGVAIAGNHCWERIKLSLPRSIRMYPCYHLTCRRRVIRELLWPLLQLV